MRRRYYAAVPNPTGWNALNNLAEYALTTGLITREDLSILRRSRAGQLVGYDAASA